MKISICDDNTKELNAVLELTEKYVRNTKTAAEILRFENAASLLAYEKGHGASDIYILDVIMPDMNGIELGQLLYQKSPASFILYLTSSKDFAIEAFSVKAFSYLIKPVNEQELYKELGLCFQKIDRSEQRIKIRDKNSIHIIKLNDVIAVEYVNHHLIYYTTAGKIEGLQQRESFDSSVRDFMDSGNFLKISSSHIINFSHIRNVTGDDFIMDNDSVFKVTRSYIDAKKKYLDYIIGE